MLLLKARKDYTDKLGRTWKWDDGLKKYVYQRKGKSATQAAATQQTTSSAADGPTLATTRQQLDAAISTVMQQLKQAQGPAQTKQLMQRLSRLNDAKRRVLKQQRAATAAAEAKPAVADAAKPTADEPPKPAATFPAASAKQQAMKRLTGDAREAAEKLGVIAADDDAAAYVAANYKELFKAGVRDDNTPQYLKKAANTKPSKLFGHTSVVGLRSLVEPLDADPAAWDGREETGEQLVDTMETLTSVRQALATAHEFSSALSSKLHRVVEPDEALVPYHLLLPKAYAMLLQQYPELAKKPVNDAELISAAAEVAQDPTKSLLSLDTNDKVRQLLSHLVDPGKPSWDQPKQQALRVNLGRLVDAARYAVADVPIRLDDTYEGLQRMYADRMSTKLVEMGLITAKQDAEAASFSKEAVSRATAQLRKQWLVEGAEPTQFPADRVNRSLLTRSLGETMQLVDDGIHTPISSLSDDARAMLTELLGPQQLAAAQPMTEKQRVDSLNLGRDQFKQAIAARLKPSDATSLPNPFFDRRPAQARVVHSSYLQVATSLPNLAKLKPSNDVQRSLKQLGEYIESQALRYKVLSHAKADNTQLPVTPKQQWEEIAALGLGTPAADAAALAHITELRKQTMSSVGAARLSRRLASKSPDNSSFLLSTVKGGERDSIVQKIKADWDHAVHKFGYKINGIYRIDEPPMQADFDAAKKRYGNVKSGLYHGTHFAAATAIARDRFSLKKKKAGRMFGNGVYLATKASKSAQYLASAGVQRQKAHGILFVADAALGNVRDGSLSNHTGDTGFGRKGALYGGMRLQNDEYAVRDPTAVRPKYWVDIALA